MTPSHSWQVTHDVLHSNSPGGGIQFRRAHQPKASWAITPHRGRGFNGVTPVFLGTCEKAEPTSLGASAGGVLRHDALAGVGIAEEDA